MTHASNPATAMVGERARLLEPRAEGGEKTRGSVFRASVALVATLALAGSAIAAVGMLRSPGDVAMRPLGVSLEEEATLRGVLNAHEPRLGAATSNEGLSLGELEDMAALLGREHPDGDASEVAESADERREEEAPEDEGEEAVDAKDEEEVVDAEEEEEEVVNEEEEEVANEEEEEETPEEEDAEEVAGDEDDSAASEEVENEEEEEETPEEEASEEIAGDEDDSSASLGFLARRVGSD